MISLRSTLSQITWIVMLLVGLTYFGCTEELNPLEPIEDSENFAGTVPYYAESHSLSLPSPKNPTGKFVESGELYSETMLINGDSTKEQKFEVKVKYTASYGIQIEMESKLKFAPNSFSGWRSVTQKFYPDHFEVQIEGNPELNEPIEADVKIKGPDFTGLGVESVEFSYKNEAGQRISPDYKEIKLKAETKGSSRS